MKRQRINKKVEINAPLEIVWRVFTDPQITRQMGGEYQTDWNIGSSIGWKGLDGKLYTHGKIREIETNQLIKHKLFDINDNNKLLSVITYKFNYNGTHTVLTGEEELNYEMTDHQLKEASDSWNTALNAVKDTAENLIK